MATALNEHHYSSKTILVVEDDPSLFKAWHRLLEGLPNVICHVVDSPLTALDWLEAHDADVLLTDIAMPGMSGLELIRLVQKKYPDMKVIATSANLEDAESAHGIDRFLHIIKKPYKNLDTLRELMALFLESADEISQVELDDPQGCYVWDL